MHTHMKFGPSMSEQEFNDQLKEPGLSPEDEDAIREASRETMQYAQPRNAAELYARARSAGRNVTWKNRHVDWEKNRQKQLTRATEILEGFDSKRSENPGSKTETPRSMDDARIIDLKKLNLHNYKKPPEEHTNK